MRPTKTPRHTNLDAVAYMLPALPGIRSGLHAARAHSATNGYSPMRHNELLAIRAYRRDTADLDDRAPLLVRLRPDSYRLAAAIGGHHAANQLLHAHRDDINRWDGAQQALAAQIPQPSDQARAYLTHERKLIEEAATAVRNATTGYAVERAA